MFCGQNLALKDLASQIGAELFGNPELIVRGVATLKEASPGTLSFFTNKKYRGYLAATKATAVVLAKEDISNCPTACLVHNDPYLAYAKAMRLIYPQTANVSGIHNSAIVEADAKIDPTAWIGPLSVIGNMVQIGADVFIGPSCVIESGCQIGANSRLVANVTLCKDTIIGCRVLIQPGAVLGADGFGYAREGKQWLHIPQIGRVCIGNDVEIGANTTIDRGSLEDTVIADGVILDNLIQIGHNVRIGDRSAIAACSGISGSTVIGRDCLIGGDVATAGHMEIGDNVSLAAGSRVTRNLSGPGNYGGVLPVDPDPLWRRNIARLRHLDELAREVRQLAQRVEEAYYGKRSKDIRGDATPDI